MSQKGGGGEDTTTLTASFSSVSVLDAALGGAGGAVGAVGGLAGAGRLGWERARTPPDVRSLQTTFRGFI